MSTEGTGYTSGGKVVITLGNGTDLAIDENDQLYVIDYSGTRIELGKATKHRFGQIRAYLTRLEVHAVAEDSPLLDSRNPNNRWK